MVKDEKDEERFKEKEEYKVDVEVEKQAYNKELVSLP